MILLGLGAGIAFNPMLLAAMSDVEPDRIRPCLGAGQHLVHDGRRARPRDPGQPRHRPHRRLLASGGDHLAALNGGYDAAFLVGAIFAASAAVLGAALLRVAAASRNGDCAAVPAGAAGRD